MSFARKFSKLGAPVRAHQSPLKNLNFSRPDSDQPIFYIFKTKHNNLAGRRCQTLGAAVGALPVGGKCTRSVEKNYKQKSQLGKFDLNRYFLSPFSAFFSEEFSSCKTSSSVFDSIFISTNRSCRCYFVISC